MFDLTARKVRKRNWDWLDRWALFLCLDQGLDALASLDCIWVMRGREHQLSHMKLSHPVVDGWLVGLMDYLVFNRDVEII